MSSCPKPSNFFPRIARVSRDRRRSPNFASLLPACVAAPRCHTFGSSGAADCSHCISSPQLCRACPSGWLVYCLCEGATVIPPRARLHTRTAHEKAPSADSRSLPHARHRDGSKAARGNCWPRRGVSSNPSRGSRDNSRNRKYMRMSTVLSRWLVGSCPTNFPRNRAGAWRTDFKLASSTCGCFSRARHLLPCARQGFAHHRTSAAPPSEESLPTAISCYRLIMSSSFLPSTGPSSPFPSLASTESQPGCVSAGGRGRGVS